MKKERKIKLAAELLDFKQSDEKDICVAVEQGLATIKMMPGDSRNILPAIAKGSAKMVLTSPPYCLPKPRDYGGVHPDKYVEWFMEFIPGVDHVLSDDGVFVLNVSAGVFKGEQMMQDIQLALEINKHRGFRLLTKYIWAKRNYCPGFWPNRFAKSHELIFVFVRPGSKIDLNRDRMLVYQAAEWRSKRLIKNPSKNDAIRNNSATGSGSGRKIDNWKTHRADCPTIEVAYPTTVLSLATSCSNVKHSAAFPQSLPEWFIKAYTNPGDIVIDPFAGTGATCRAARKLGRASIGIDAKPCELFVKLSGESNNVFFSSDTDKSERRQELIGELKKLLLMQKETGMYPSVVGYKLFQNDGMPVVKESSMTAVEQILPAAFSCL